MQSMVTICFDDGRLSAARDGARVLERHYVRGTFYPIPSRVGTHNEHGIYASWEDLRTLKASGHEIGNHTRQHIHEWLSWPLHRQREEISSAARMMMRDGGLDMPKTFAYPWGLHTESLRKIISTTLYSGQYIAARTVEDGVNVPADDPYALKAFMVESRHALWDVEERILAAREQKNSWLILVFHHIGGDTFISTPPELFERMILCAIKHELRVVTLKQGAEIMYGAQMT